MENSVMKIRDAKEQIIDVYGKEKMFVSLKDRDPALYNILPPEKRKIHDGNFAFVMTELSKLDTKVYEPKQSITYLKDIPVEYLGGGLVDFIDYFTVDYGAMGENPTGNNLTIIPRVNSKLNHNAVPVHTFQLAYDISFVELEKLDRITFPKALDTIYKDAILFYWNMFCQKIAYEGNNGSGGLFNSKNVFAAEIPIGTKDASKYGFAQMTDQEIVATINGILSMYLVKTGNNLDLLPDTFLVPPDSFTEMFTRYSDLFTNTIMTFIMDTNIGTTQAIANGMRDYKFSINGRAGLATAGTYNAGRIVAYRKNKDYVCLTIPYQIQQQYTGPNAERAGYSTFFVGQVSEIKMPYNTDSDTFGAVSYWDFAKPTA